MQFSTFLLGLLISTPLSILALPHPPTQETTGSLSQTDSSSSPTTVKPIFTCAYHKDDEGVTNRGKYEVLITSNTRCADREVATQGWQGCHWEESKTLVLHKEGAQSHASASCWMPTETGPEKLNAWVKQLMEKCQIQGPEPKCEVLETTKGHQSDETGVEM